MAKTLALPKDQLVKQALTQMQKSLADNTWTDRQKLALTCRILFENGHDSGLAGQITARGPQPGTYYTQQLGLGFDEITASNLLLVNEDLEVLEGHGMANPANRFHSWVYRARPDVNCIIHTHPTHVAALSMLEVPLQISHMDLCPLYDDCAFLEGWPGVPVGHFGFVDGPAMASVDWARLKVIGKGGHGAEPQGSVDPILAAAHIITALQTVVSRNVDPLDMGVVTVGSIHGGNAPNVVPESVELKLTARAFKPEVREILNQRIPAIARAQAESFGATAEVLYLPGYPAVLNHEAETELARSVARDTFGDARVDAGFRPRTASEDFAFMLLKRPGSYVFVGNGDGASLHSPYYDFNDAILAPSATYWVRLAERFLA